MANSQSKYPDRTKLWIFPNAEKKTEKQPDWQGPGEITKGALKDLIDAYKEFGEGDKLKLRCAGWSRVSKKGGTYNFVTIEADTYKPDNKDIDDVPF